MSRNFSMASLPKAGTDIDTYSDHHGQTDKKLGELKSIIIKYLPSDVQHNNRLMAALYDLYNCENFLSQHAKVEDEIFVPAIRHLEKRRRIRMCRAR